MKHFKDIKNVGDYSNIEIKHPLIDIRRYEDIRRENIIKKEPITFDFYKISFVKNFNGNIQIGNTKLEGDNGILHFVEPQQVYTCNSTNPWEGFHIMIHSDIFNKHFSHKNIRAYDFFSYQVNESLLLDKEEQDSVNLLMEMAWSEFNNGKDSFSIPIVLSHISTLLNLTDRFYARQFDTRKALSNQLSNDFYKLLKNYYTENTGTEVQQPTVQLLASQLNVTPNYLSDTIRHVSGESALTVVHHFVIEEAKALLANTSKTVSEISFQLGFEYPTYFSRLFKKKTDVSPSEFRKSVKSI